MAATGTTGCLAVKAGFSPMAVPAATPSMAAGAATCSLAQPATMSCSTTAPIHWTREGDDVLSGGNDVDEVKGSKGGATGRGDIDRAGSWQGWGDELSIRSAPIQPPFAPSTCTLAPRLPGAPRSGGQDYRLRDPKSGAGRHNLGSDGNEEIYSNAGNDLIHGGGGMT
jgi:hypothetical protein